MKLGVQSYQSTIKLGSSRHVYAERRVLGEPHNAAVLAHMVQGVITIVCGQCVYISGSKTLHPFVSNRNTARAHVN